MTMIIKTILIILFVGIFFSLGSALFFLVRGKEENDINIVKALTWRIVLSMVLFAILLFAFAMGWIVPHQVL